jgi:hypothetical protein
MADRIAPTLGDLTIFVFSLVAHSSQKEKEIDM